MFVAELFGETMCLRRLLLGLSIALSLAIVLPFPAHGETGGCRGSTNNPLTCQYLVTSGGIAPPPSTSAGIRQPRNTSLVLYDRESDSSLYGYCRYITNNSENNYLVPQGSKNDFVNFLTNPPAGVTLINCAMPTSYTPTPSFAFTNFNLFSEGGDAENGSGPAPLSSLGASFSVPTPSAVQPVGTVVTISPSFTYSRSDCRNVHNATVCNPPVTVVETQTIQFTATAPASAWADGAWAATLLSDQCTVNGVATGAAPNGCLSGWVPPPDCHAYATSWVDSSTGASCSGSFSGTTPDTNYLNLQTDLTTRNAPVNQGSATFLCQKGTYVLQPGSTCVAPLYGTCGSAISGSSYAAPAANLCASGTATIPTEDMATGYWSWICQGSSVEENSPACHSGIILDGVCGSAANAPASAAPDSNLCSSGVSVAAINNGTGSWIWTCSGVNGGRNASCAAPTGTAQATSGSACSSQGHGYCSDGSRSSCTVTRSSPANCSGRDQGSICEDISWVCGSSICTLSNQNGPFTGCD